MEREVRYTVFKISDVTEALDPDEATTLIELEEKVAIYRESVGKSPLECVVVESDWPEYDPTWQAIERRVDGQPGMNIEEIFTELQDLGCSMADKARRARETARKSHKRGELKKRDKFNAVARAYEMMHEELNPLCVELLDHTSGDFRNKDVPF